MYFLPEEILEREVDLSAGVRIIELIYNRVPSMLNDTIQIDIYIKKGNHWNKCFSCSRSIILSAPVFVAHGVKILIKRFS